MHLLVVFAGMLSRALLRAVLSILCAVLSMAGCSSLQQDTPDRVRFALPQWSFTIANSPDTEWLQPPAEIPNFLCAGPEALGSDCCSPPLPSASIDCQVYPLRCNPADNLCALFFDVSDSQDVDLAPTLLQLAGAPGRVLSSARLVNLTATVTDADDLPDVKSAALFIAPEDTRGVSSPALTLLAPVGLTSESQMLIPDVAAEQAFSFFVKAYQGRFAVLLLAHVITKTKTASGGSIHFNVTGEAEAWY